MFNQFCLQRPTLPPDETPSLTIGVGADIDPSDFVWIADEIIHRLPAQASSDGAWTKLVSSFHRVIVEMAEGRESLRLARLLSFLQVNNLGAGIGWSNYNRQSWDNEASYRWLIKAGMMDSVTSLAALIGVARLENPEAAQAGSMARLDGNLLLEKLDAHFGYELASPRGFSRNLGIVRPSGMICDYRTLWAAATSERILQILDDLGVPPGEASVLEIGGGVGNLALHCLKRGIGRYSIVDLPTTRAIQTYVALTELPEMTIGYERPTERLNLLTPEGIEAVSDRSVHLVVNEDSLPEMAEESGRRYIQQIARICSGRFLSINHEAGYELNGHRLTRVADLCGGILSRRQRSPHWMRRGYLEEVFCLPDQTSRI